MAKFILIHGAWGNATGWARLIPLLEAKGHEARAIDLPGHGADPTPPAGVGMGDYVEKAEALLREAGPACVVGHSMGGIVTAMLSARCPDLVQKAIYVAALLPREGESLVSLIEQQEGAGVVPAIVRGPEKGVTLLDPDLAPPILFADASPRDQQRAMAAMSPQSNKAQKDPATLGPRFDEVPRAYVFCTEDRTVEYALQQRMVAATPCAQTATLDCGHVPQLTRAADLAAILDELAP